MLQDLSSLPSGRTAKPFVLVIFGASGDLTRRKLIPALFGLFKEKSLPDQFQIIGFARREKTEDAFREEMLEGIKKYSRFSPISDADWNAFAPHLSYHIGNFDDAAAYQSLSERVARLKQEKSLQQELYYLSTAPECFTSVMQHLHGCGLVSPQCRSRVVIEKPFGHDYQSAKELVSSLQSCISESCLYRIDHYLGKETVQNLLYFRFANSIYEPIWNRSLIDHVQITVAEDEGVGTRGAYYDQVGALRDMVQNHLMQLLTITSMEPPGTLNSEAIRDEKVKVLKSIPTPSSANLENIVVRAQYEGYRQSDRVNPASSTETYVALKLMIDNWRWAGVPFYLRTGKFLRTRASEIIVVFRRPPLTLFHATDREQMHRNRLHIRLQPDEGIHLQFNAKVPGKSAMGSVDMDFAYKNRFGSYSPEAYERLLHDFIVGDSTLFTRSDEVLEAWRIVDAISKGWQDSPVAIYRQGDWGPTEANYLLKRDGNSWIPLDQKGE
ncbi:MAG: glucose-6-phosphate dehydrogenase [Methylacidiphilales bacterium]|nr:glucose-6-phosphate dehydrogenase [Candidatus Methylacidiphilales bacterium]